MGDVLALSRVPREVVLAACDSATTADVQVAGLGLGQAFVIAGATAVVASTRPVGDKLAARIFSTFHGSPGDAAERLRGASLAALDDDPGADVSSFRVLVP